MLQMENMSAWEQILVVDDKPMICKSCKEILEDEGFFVDMAYSGEEGLKKGLEKKFDLVDSGHPHAGHQPDSSTATCPVLPCLKS